MALVIFIFVFVSLLITDKHIGFTWDEPAYIVAAESYSHWFGELFQDPAYAFSAEGIEAYWDVNHEHPPMNKIWSGLVWAASRNLLPDLTAHRLGNMILNSLLFVFLFLLVKDEYGWETGVLASVFLFSMPRVFFHAHLTSLDLAVVSLIVAVMLLFWKTRENESWWVDIALGLVWGLAVSTKVNAVFALFVLGIWTLIYCRHKFMFRRLFIMGVVAVPLFLVTWPWLFHDSLWRILEYVWFITIGHWQIGQWYLNQYYLPPPWHFPFVLTAVIVPLTLLILFIIGSIRTLALKNGRSFGVFLLLNVFFPMIVLALGQSVVYDNDRLFIGAMPFMAALAAIGFYALVQKAKQWLSGWQLQLAVAVMLLLVLLPPAVEARSLYPHFLSYYSHLIGGVSGADRAGFEVTYWTSTYHEVLDYLNENGNEGDVVWVEPYSFETMTYYQLQGLLRDDLVITAPEFAESLLDPDRQYSLLSFEETDFVVFQNRKTVFGEEGFDSSLAKWLAERTPAYEVTHDGVPLIMVFTNP